MTDLHQLALLLGEPFAPLAPALPDVAAIAYRCRGDDALSMEYIGEGVRRITGLSPSELTAGRVRWADLIRPQHLDWPAEMVRRAASGEPFRLVYRVAGPEDRTERWVCQQGQAIFDEGGHVVAYEGLITELVEQPGIPSATGPAAGAGREDATSEQALRDTLRQSHSTLQRVLDNAGIGFAVTDPAGKVLATNAYLHRIFGTSPDTQRADESPGYRVTTRDGREVLPEQMPLAAALRGETAPETVLSIKRADGVELIVRADAAPLLRDDGIPYAAVAVYRDVTERIRTEEALAHEREMLQRIYDNIPIMLIQWNPRLKRFTLNRHAEQVLGWTTDDANDGDFMSRVYPDPDYRARVSEYMRSLVAGWREWNVTAKDGRVVPSDWANVRLSDETMIGIGVDRREHKAAQAALQASEERYRTLVGVMPAGVYACDAEGRITFFNEGAEAIWGCRPRLGDSDQLFCGSFRLHRPDGTPLRHEDAPMAAAVREGRRFRNEEVIIERPDGGTVHVLVNIEPLRDAEGRAVGAINAFIDITARRKAEDAVRAREASFRQLADAMPHLVWTALPGGIVDYVNARRAEYAGIHETDDRTWSWLGTVIAEDEEHTRDVWRSAMARGEPYQVEHRLRKIDGSVRWHLSRAYPVTDETGAVAKWFGTATDIDDLKLAQEVLRDADRRKNEFLATLAHELRNPLAPIRNALEVLHLVGKPDPALQTARAIIDRQLRHLVRLIDDLMDVSRITRGRLILQRERVDLRSVLAEALEAARAYQRCKDQTLSIAMPEEPFHLDGDPVRLTQIFLNLLNNACKYTGEHGTIHVRVERDGQCAVVNVTDNGIGISADQLPMVFEMFTQLGTPGQRSVEGLGIGLSLAKALAEMHGGSIEAHSEGAGEGSEFVVRLPIADEPAPTACPDESAPEAGRPRRILVADDNRDILESLAMLLSVLGHDVETAGDGVEAVAAAARYKPDVVLLDIGMPGLDGYGACRAIREQPGGSALLMLALTGWGQDDDRRKSRDAGFDGHLVKPVEPAELMRWLSGRGLADEA